MKSIVLVGLGGAAGSILRYLCQKILYNWYPSVFPVGTLVVNIAGCFLIGLVYALSEKGDLLTAEWRILLATGLCGGFTTFSSFAYENISLLRSGDFLYFSLYAVGSVVLGLLAAYAGVVVIKLV